MRKSLEISNFYPKEMEIVNIYENVSSVIIKVKSRTKKQCCPYCGKESNSYHSTYVRKVRDLPILNRSVVLAITAYKYYCNNNECQQKVFAEELNGFTGKSRRMTERLENLIVAIGLNTNCEATARICHSMGIIVSGDTVIRLLLKNVSIESVKPEEIGIDDWAYRKRKSYCTIICDLKTHKPIALLEGRDGKNLEEWLKENKQVKVVTRDRAGTFAKVISNSLPDAIQVADRFHIYQNLLIAVRDALNSEIPTKIEILEEKEVEVKEPAIKKTHKIRKNNEGK